MNDKENKEWQERVEAFNQSYNRMMDTYIKRKKDEVNGK